MSITIIIMGDVAIKWTVILGMDFYSMKKSQIVSVGVVSRLLAIKRRDFCQLPTDVMDFHLYKNVFRLRYSFGAKAFSLSRG
jgi:hypothetical protein